MVEIRTWYALVFWASITLIVGAFVFTSGLAALHYDACAMWANLESPNLTLPSESFWECYYIWWIEPLVS